MQVIIALLRSAKRFVLRFISPLSAKELIRIENFGHLHAQGIEGSRIDVYCERKVFRDINEDTGSGEVDLYVYRLYSECSREAPESLQRACRLEVHYPFSDKTPINNQAMFDLLAAHYVELLKFRLHYAT